MTATPRERSFSTQALVDLVLDPRDPGYAAAAQDHGGRREPRWYERPATAAVCLVIGFVLAMAWEHTHRAAPTTAKVHAGLVQRVRVAQHTDDRLAATEAALSADLDRVRTAALADSAQVVRDLDRSRLLAGELAATGPGVEITLSEPKMSTAPTGLPGRGDRAPVADGHILIDRDVRSVVNELWAAGAEAVAVNGIRLTPTSAIRFAGDAVLVDFQPINSPYVVHAIGNSGLLITGFAASDVASRYQTLAGAKGIGFSFAEKDQLSLPASPGNVVRYAHVGPGRR